MGAIYAHPVDFLATNLVPTILPSIILKFPHNINNFIILFATSYTVIISHGGFLIFNENKSSHLKHHILRDGNYGLLFSDKIYKFYH